MDRDRQDTIPLHLIYHGNLIQSHTPQFQRHGFLMAAEIEIQSYVFNAIIV